MYSDHYFNNLTGKPHTAAVPPAPALSSFGAVPSTSYSASTRTDPPTAPPFASVGGGGAAPQSQPVPSAYAGAGVAAASAYPSLAGMPSPPYLHTPGSAGAGYPPFSAAQRPEARDPEAFAARYGAYPASMGVQDGRRSTVLAAQGFSTPAPTGSVPSNLPSSSAGNPNCRTGVAYSTTPAAYPLPPPNTPGYNPYAPALPSSAYQPPHSSGPLHRTPPSAGWNPGSMGTTPTPSSFSPPKPSWMPELPPPPSGSSASGSSSSPPRTVPEPVTGQVVKDQFYHSGPPQQPQQLPANALEGAAGSGRRATSSPSPGGLLLSSSSSTPPPWPPSFNPPLSEQPPPPAPRAPAYQTPAPPSSQTGAAMAGYDGSASVADNNNNNHSNSTFSQRERHPEHRLSSGRTRTDRVPDSRYPQPHSPRRETVPLAPLARPPPPSKTSRAALPNPVELFQEPFGYFECAAGTPMPRAAVGFIGHDAGGACNPKFIRPTSVFILSEGKMMKNSGLPMGAVLSPLHGPLRDQLSSAEGQTISERVPVIYDRAPVRCHRCRGYISSQAVFMEMGKTWVCSLCRADNPVEDAYFAHLTPQGTRMDAHLKPELSCAAVEWDVESFPDYALRNAKGTALHPSRPLAHLFAIDISRHAARVYLDDYVVAVREAVAALRQSSPRSPVSFVFYAAQLHFCNFRDARMPLYSVPDVDSPFVALPFEKMCWLDLELDADAIENTLNHIRGISDAVGEDGCSMGAVMQVLLQIFGGQPGGKAFLCGHRFPRAGAGSAIPPRDYRKLYGSAKEKELLRPIPGSPWSQWANSAALAQISVDLLLFPAEYCELVTLSQLCHTTGGEAFLFSRYEPGGLGQEQIIAALRGRCEEEAGYGGILRLRCSTGLHVQRYRGHYLAQTAQDMDLAGVSARSTYFAEIAHDAKLEDGGSKPLAHLQVALLYTTRTGRRRVRVQNYPLGIVNTCSQFFAGADIESVLFAMASGAAMEAFNKGVAEARTYVNNVVLDFCVGYEKFALPPQSKEASRSSPVSAPILRLPSALKHLPLYGLSLVKSDGFCVGTTVGIDERIQVLQYHLTTPLPQLLRYVLPDLFALHVLTSNPDFGTVNRFSGEVVLPPRRLPDYSSVSKGGVYALCDEASFMVYLWIGSMVPPAVAMELFGVEDANLVGRDPATPEQGGGNNATTTHPDSSMYPPAQRSRNTSEALASTRVPPSPAGYSSVFRPAHLTQAWESRFGERLQRVLETLRYRDGKARRLVVMHEGELSEELFFRMLRAESSNSSDLGYGVYIGQVHKNVRKKVVGY